MQFDIFHIVLLLIAACASAAAVYFSQKKTGLGLSADEERKLKDFDLINSELQKAQAALTFVEKQSDERQAANDKLQQNNIELNGAFSTAQADANNARSEIEKLNIAVENLTKENTRLIQENKLIEVARTDLEAQKKALDERIKEQQSFISEAQKNLREQFENISNRQLEAHSEKFIKNSSENIGSLLNPLKENIEKFKAEIAETYGKESRERFALGKEIERIVEVNNKMTSTTENLTKALKGDRKMQGNWGEMLLEKLLEDSGLVKDKHYTTQESFVNEEGQRLLPDFKIKLPEGKHIIVDSKVSLVAYERYFNEEIDDAKQLHARGFVDSVKNHVKDLSLKRYQDNKEGSSLDFVIMFMPIEGTFQFLSQHSPDIFQHGWKHKVIITSPVTLFPVLQTISSIWKVEAQNRNTQEIIRLAGSLYDKFVNFGASIEEIGKHIEKSESAYKTALSRLRDGKGNIISTVKTLESFGIDKKGNKKVPAFMQLDEDTKQTSSDEIETLFEIKTEEAA